MWKKKNQICYSNLLFLSEKYPEMFDCMFSKNIYNENEKSAFIFPS